MAKDKNTALAVANSNEIVTQSQEQTAAIAVNSELDMDFFKDIDSMRYESMWETRTMPKDVLAKGETFDIVDAAMADFEFEDSEVTTQCIFILQYKDGTSVTIFQKRNGMREKMASRFVKARLSGHKLVLTNVQMAETEKKIAGNAALIFKPTKTSQVLVDGKVVA